MKRIIDFFRSLDAFGFALMVSLLAHVVLLTIKFVDPERFDKVFNDEPLEVILVNAKSDTAPDKAQAIAQYNLAGGGQLDKGRASSPLPLSSLSSLTSVADAARLDYEQKEKKIQNMLDQQMQLLASLKKELASMPKYTKQELEKNPEKAAKEKMRQQLLKQFAEIDKRIRDENARPKKHFISPATRKGPHALYYAKFKDAVEELGTRNFPTVAGRRLYGELTMVTSLDVNGNVISAEVFESSGSRDLDRLAQTIVRAGAPYGEFSLAMRKEYGILVIASRFRFTKEQILETANESFGG